MGHLTTTFSVVKFKTDALEVEYSSSVESLGSKCFDEALMRLVCDRIETKYKIKPEGKKVLVRIKKAVVKVKHILTSNKDARFYEECLMEDIDISFTITRDEFEKSIKNYLISIKEISQKFISHVTNTLNIAPAKNLE